MSTSDIISTVAAAISLAGLVVLLFQVHRAREELRSKAESENDERARQRRVDTLKFLMDNLDDRKGVLKGLPSEHDVVAMQRFSRRLPCNPRSRKLRDVIPYLGHYEDIAVASRSGMYDVVIVDALHGERMSNVLTGYQNFFDAYRIATKNPAFLWNFELLVKTQIRPIEEAYHADISHEVISGASPPKATWVSEEIVREERDKRLKRRAE